MKQRTKRQQKQIDYFLREKHSRKEKQELIHNKELPKFVEKHLPVVRRLSRNLDQLLIVSSFYSPPIKLGIIDRLLIVAELEDVKPIICLNKSDLVFDKLEIDSVRSIYKNIGYKVIVTSAKTGRGIKELKKMIQDKRSALSGHSGVGKSSLLNKVQPNLQILTGNVSEWSNKGRHTTSQLTTYKLDETTTLVDLPGLKKLDFLDIHKTEAKIYFKEFNYFAEECKFANCLHLTEQQCAVKKAVEEAKISSARYDSYLNFIESL